MASGASLQTKIKNLLAKLDASGRVVSFRQVSTSGGSSLLGVGQTTLNIDTVCSPQPAVQLLRADEVAVSGGVYQMGDYRLTFDGTVPETTFRTSLIVYGDEVLKPVTWTPSAIYGVAIAWQVIARSIKTGS